MNDDTLFADGFNDAILGLSSEWENVPRVVYSKHKMILIIMIMPINMLLFIMIFVRQD